MSKKSAQSKDASKSVSKDEFDGKVVPSLQESVISRTNSDNTVSIVNLELDDVCYSLDGIAAEIWTQIDGKNTLEKIKDSMIKKHKPPIDQFDGDFSNLFHKLSDEKLIAL